VWRYAERLPYLWRFAARATRPFHALDRNGRRRAGQVTLERTPWPGRMAALVADLGGDGRIRHVRDRGYFEWRFQNPLSTYRFLYWMSAELEGYLVLHAPAHRPGGPVSLIDWEARDRRVLAGLLEAALTWGRFGDLSVWTAAVPAGGRALLRDSGFVAAPTTESIGHAFRTKRLRPTLLATAVGAGATTAQEWTVDGRRVLDLESWDLRMVYSDSF
jgi:hypothetical protein